MYVSTAEVKTVLAAVDTETDDDYQGTAAELSDELIQLHIEDAEAQVNVALNGKYPVPFADNSVPHLIKAITRALAAYFAELTYRKTRSLENNDVPAVRRFNWAREQLDMLRTGKIDLAGTNSDGAYVAHVYDGPLFKREHDLLSDRPGLEVHWLWEVS